MKAKHPRRKEAATPLTAVEMEAPRKGARGEVLRTKLGQLNHDVAPGLGGLRNEHLHALVMNDKRQQTPSALNAVDNLCDYANTVISIEIPRYFYVAWLATRLVPANKTGPVNLPRGMEASARPINVGYVGSRLITRAYSDDDLQAAHNCTLGSVQNGCDIHGGISITAFGVMAMLDARPEFGTIQADIRNGFNKVKHESILDTKETPGLLCTLAFSNALLEPMTYVGMGSGTNLVTSPFLSEEGSQQGSTEGGWFFVLVVNAPFQQLNSTLVAAGGEASAIMDNNYAMRPPSVIFPANEQLQRDLAVVGLELQPAKSCCYIDAAHQDNKWHRLRGAIPEGVLKDGVEVILVDG